MKWFKLLLIFNFIFHMECVVIHLLNKLYGEISVAAQARSGFPLPDGGAWVLNKNERKSVTLPDVWSGHFWARTWCMENDALCQTGDCGKFECKGKRGQSPATLAEFVFRGRSYIDYYSISLEDGFNAKVMITPLNEHGAKSRCKEIFCTADINYDCPQELVVIYEGENIGCRSACAVFADDEYCCNQPYNTSDTCKPNKYSRIFKQKCPQTRSYKYDNVNSVFSCQADSYLITFSQ